MGLLTVGKITLSFKVTIRIPWREYSVSCIFNGEYRIFRVRGELPDCI
jgi:hypothetical protein